MVEVDHSTESLPAFYSTTSIDRAIGILQEEIIQPLMISLFVVVRHVLHPCALKR